MRKLEALTVLHKEEKTGRPIAYSYDASTFSGSALETIINYQINRSHPLEILYRIDDGGSYYQAIEAREFTKLRRLKPSVKEQFIKGKVRKLKQLSTQEIIFAEPIKIATKISK